MGGHLGLQHPFHQTLGKLLEQAMFPQNVLRIRIAFEFLDGLTNLSVSAVVTYIKLVQGCRNKQELNRLKRDLAGRQVVFLPIAAVISDRAVALIETYALGSGLQLADALIAATALEHRLSLATGNAKHFNPIPDFDVQTFSP